MRCFSYSLHKLLVCSLVLFFMVSFLLSECQFKGIVAVNHLLDDVWDDVDKNRSCRR